jgi:ACS family D-galactonate transporter-like MFS transporter
VTKKSASPSFSVSRPQKCGSWVSIQVADHVPDVRDLSGRVGGDQGSRSSSKTMDDSAGNMSNTRRWTIVGLLFVAGVINYLDRAVVSVALPLIAADLHQGPAAKGVLLSAFFWSYALMQLPMGWCADRYNLRWFYAGGFALWSLACGLTGFAGSLAVMLVLRIVLGIGESVYLPGGVKIVSLLFHSRDRGLASGLANCGTRVGLAVGVPLIAWLVATLSWQKTFFFVGFASLIWIVPWLAIFPRRIAVSRPQRPLAETRPWRSLDRNLVGLCLGHIGFSYYWTLLVTWLPDYLVGARLDRRPVGETWLERIAQP